MNPQHILVTLLLIQSGSQSQININQFLHEFKTASYGLDIETQEWFQENNEISISFSSIGLDYYDFGNAQKKIIVGIYTFTQYQNHQCPKECTQCSKNICFQCQIGYFHLAINQESQICVQCPFYEQLWKSKRQILCGDCIDNPMNWKYNLRCTYFYSSKINDDDSLLYQQYSQPLLYSIVQQENTYILEQCINCKEFKQNYFENGIINLEKMKQFLCNDEYYLDQDLNKCLQCSENCLICKNQSECTECNTGFSIQNQTCKQCQELITGCLQCQIGYENIQDLVCVKCQYPLLLNKDLKECIDCQNKIQFCEKCYYKDLNGSANTIYPEYDVFYLVSQKLEISPLKCQRCIEGYQLNEENSQCLPVNEQLPEGCLKSYIQNEQVKCLECQKPYSLFLKERVCQLLGYQVPNQPQDDDDDDNDNDQDYDSWMCDIFYLDQTSYTHYCAKCQEGYYFDLLSGACLICVGCDTCYYQTQNKRFFAFEDFMLYSMQQEMIFAEKKLEENILVGHLNTNLLKRCYFEDNETSCHDGFYFNEKTFQCLQKEKECKISSNGCNKCTEVNQENDKIEICLKCDQEYSQSLFMNQKQCLQVIDGCSHFVQMTQEQIYELNPQFINQNFIPQLCQIYDSEKKNLYFNSRLRKPNKCLNNMQCIKTQLHYLEIDCHQQEELSLYKFNTINTKQYIQMLNEIGIEYFQIFIEFKNKDLENQPNNIMNCKFEDSLNIFNDLYQNVYSIVDVNLKMISSQAQFQEGFITNIFIDGIITLQDFRNVQIKDLNFYHYSLYQDFSKNTRFGLNIYLYSFGIIQLDNISIKGNMQKISYESDKSSFQFIMSDISQLAVNNLKIEQITLKNSKTKGFPLFIIRLSNYIPELKIDFKQFKLDQVIIFQESLFILEMKFDLNDIWFFENLQVTNSHIILSQMFTQFSDTMYFTINKLELDQIFLLGSKIFNFEKIKQLTIQSFKINNLSTQISDEFKSFFSQYTIHTQLITSNTFLCNSLIVDNSNFYHASLLYLTFFKNENVDQDNYPYQIQEFTITKVQIGPKDFFVIGLDTENDFKIKIEYIKFDGLQIYNEGNQKVVLFNFHLLNKLKIQKFLIINFHYQSKFQLIQCQQLKEVDLKNFEMINDSDGIQELFQEPQTYEQYINYSLNDILILIIDHRGQLKLENIILKYQIQLSMAFIRIIEYEPQEVEINYNLTNIQFISNIQVQQQHKFVHSSVIIDAKSLIQINIENLEIKNIHKYFSFDYENFNLEIETAALVIQAKSSILNMFQSFFSENYGETQTASVLIIAQQINISFTEFLNNKFDFGQSSALYLSSSIIYLQQVTFKNLVHNSKGVLTIETAQINNLEIDNCQFQNIQTNNKEQTNQGVIFHLSVQSGIAHIKLKKVVNENLISSNMVAELIYIDAKNSQINFLIDNLIIKNIQLLKGIIEFTEADQISTFSFKDLTIKNEMNIKVQKKQINSYFKFNNIKELLFENIEINNLNDFYHFNLKDIFEVVIINLNIKDIAFQENLYLFNISQIKILSINQLKCSNVTVQSQNNNQNKQKAQIQINQIDKFILNNSFIEQMASNDQYESVFSLQSREIIIDNNIVTNCNNFYFGIYFIQQSQSVTFQNSEFINNTAQYGGALYFRNVQNALISNTNFFKNEAFQEGGAIYYTIESSLDYANKDKLLNIEHSIFYNNLSPVGNIGRMVGIIPILDQYGIAEQQRLIDEIAYPKKIQLNFNDTEAYILEMGSTMKLDFQISSGEFLPISLIPLDIKNQKLLMNKIEEKEPFIFDSQFDYEGINTVYWSNELEEAKFQDIQIFFDPYIYETIQFQISSIIPLNVDLEDNQMNYQPFESTFEIKTKKCQLGEEWLNNQMICQPCLQEYYSLYKKERCIKCNKQTMNYCQGGSLIDIKFGYWRKHNMTDLIYYCQNYPENCLGGTRNFTCSDGTIGALCESCDIYGEINGIQYTNSEPYICQTCSKSDELILKFVGVTVVSWILMFFSIYSALQAIILQNDLFIANCLGFVGGKFTSTKRNIGILMKMLTHYMQIIGALTEFQLPVPDAFDSFLNIAGNPAKQMVYSMNCFLVEISIDNSINVIYVSAIYELLLPICIACVFLIGYILQVLVLKKRFKIFIIYITWIYTFITYQPNIVKSLIDLVSPRRVGDTFYIKSNMRYEYVTPDHIYYLFRFLTPCLILLVFVIPLLALLKLSVNKECLQKITFQLKWSFLYAEYTNKGYFWEFVKIFEKIIITVVLSLFQQYAAIKGALIYTAILVYEIMLSLVYPFQQQKLNELDQRQATICSLSVIIAIMLFYNTDNQFVLYFGYVIIFVINIYYLLTLILELLFDYLTKFEDKINNVKLKLISIFPCLERFMRVNKVGYKRVKELWKKLKVLIEANKEKLKDMAKEQNNDRNLRRKRMHPFMVMKKMIGQKEQQNDKMVNYSIKLFQLKNGVRQEYSDEGPQIPRHQLIRGGGVIQ